MQLIIIMHQYVQKIDLWFPRRMLDKVKSEVDVFSMSFEDVDFLDQVVHNLQKLFDIGFFQVSVAASPSCSFIIFFYKHIA